MAHRKAPVRLRFTEEALYQLDCLLDFTSAEDLREYLMEIYHHYIIHKHESLPENFQDMAESIQILFDVLKFMEEEVKTGSIKN